MMKAFYLLVSKLWPGIGGIGILAAFYFAGLGLAHLIPFPVPGSVVGMAMIFIALQIRILPLAWVDAGAVWLLSLLGLFYVPFGVGIVESGSLITAWGWPVFIIIMLTVLIVFGISSKVFGYLISRTKKPE